MSLSFLCQRIDGALVEQLLRAMESLESPPDAWGEAPGLRNPYDHRAIVSFVERVYPDRALTWTPLLRRTSEPRYTITWLANSWRDLAWLLGTEQPPARGRILFELTLAIASAVPVEVGGCERESRRGDLYGPLFSEFGLTGLYPRNVFGPRLVQLFGGIDVLRQAGLRVTEQSNGNVVADVVDDVQNADSAALDSALLAIEGRLRATGLFAEYVMPDVPTPGRRWRPAVRT